MMSALSGTPRPASIPRPSEPNLGILTEVPLPARVTTGLHRVVDWYIRASTPIASLSFLILILIITTPARQVVAGWWFDVALTVTLILLATLIGKVDLSPYWKFLWKQIFGKPAFGDAGGIGERLLRATFRAARDVDLTFGTEDQKVIDRVVTLDSEIMPTVLRHNFIEARQDTGADEKTLEDQWDRTWKQIQNAPIEGTTLAKVQREHPYALGTIPFWLTSSLTATAAVDLFLLITVWLGYRWATGAGSVLPIVQVTVLFSFITAAWIFVNRAYRAADLPIRFPPRARLSELGVDDETLDEAEALAGRVLKPLDVRLGPQYFRELVAFSMRALAIDSIRRGVSFIVIVGTSLAAGLLFRNDGEALATTYSRLALVVVVAFVGFLVGHYLVSLVLQDVRRTFAPVVSGLVGAAIPLLGQYLLAGGLSEDPQALTQSIALGMFGVVATVLAEIVKARFEARPRTSLP